VLFGICVLYLLFVIINCKHINEAINCIRLASLVMAQNCSLIFQPVWNVIIKLLLILGFMVLIGISLSSGSLLNDTISLYYSDGTTTATKDIGGVARSFSRLYAFDIGTA